MPELRALLAWSSAPSILGLIAILALAAVQMAPADADRHALMMGSSALVCPWLIAGLALPLFGGLFWALRQLADLSDRGWYGEVSRKFAAAPAYSGMGKSHRFSRGANRVLQKAAGAGIGG